MILIISAGLCSLVPPLYLVRLMADARKLRARLLEQPLKISHDAQEQEEEELLIQHDYAKWTAFPYHSDAPASSGDQPQASS